MDDQIRRLRPRLEALRRGRTPRGVRYPVPVRAAVAELARDARGVSTLAQALGLPLATITRWRRAHRRRMRRITIAPAPAALGPPPSPAGPVLISPQGWRVEGLDLDMLVRLLQLQA